MDGTISVTFATCHVLRLRLVLELPKVAIRQSAPCPPRVHVAFCVRPTVTQRPGRGARLKLPISVSCVVGLAARRF